MQRVSVIIPSYNRGKLTQRAVESLLSQSQAPSEIIIIDDGSEGEHQAQLEKIKDLSPLIRLIPHSENKGTSASKNTGIKAAQFEWVCFLDSDDEWLPQKLQSQLQETLASEKLFSFTDESWVKNGKKIQKKKHQLKSEENLFERSLEYCLIGTSTVLIHKNVFDQVGVFDESLKVCEDYDLWLRILLEFEACYIDQELVVKHAGHSGQLSFETPLMDWYRVQSLYKILRSEESIPEQKLSIKKVLLKKSKVLLHGSVKHQNFSLEKKIRELLKFANL